MQAKSPYISLIVPVYNTGAYLRECIDSIIAQPFKDYELILVDDGSTDESPEIESYYAGKYDNISVLHSNSGCVSSARNMGVAHAIGEYILFVDSDDYLLPDGLSTLHQASLRFQDADFIQAPFSVLSNGTITSRSKRFDVLDQFAEKQWQGLEYIDKMSLNITYPWNSLIKRSFIAKTEIAFNPQISAQEDLLYILELFSKGAKGVLLRKPTYLYRFGRPGSLTSVDTKLSPEEVAKRKRLLRSLIDCSICLKNIASTTPPQWYSVGKMLNDRITLNLTGCIGGCALLHPDKEIMEYLTAAFPKIPLHGKLGRKILAILYNINHKLAYQLRRISIK